MTKSILKAVVAGSLGAHGSLVRDTTGKGHFIRRKLPRGTIVILVAGCWEVLEVDTKNDVMRNL